MTFFLPSKVNCYGIVWSVKVSYDVWAWGRNCLAGKGIRTCYFFSYVLFFSLELPYRVLRYVVRYSQTGWGALLSNHTGVHLWKKKKKLFFLGLRLPVRLVASSFFFSVVPFYMCFLTWVTLSKERLPSLFFPRTNSCGFCGLYVWCLGFKLM